MSFSHERRVQAIELHCYQFSAHIRPPLYTSSCCSTIILSHFLFLRRIHNLNDFISFVRYMASLIHLFRTRGSSCVGCAKEGGKKMGAQSDLFLIAMKYDVLHNPKPDVILNHFLYLGLSFVRNGLDWWLWLALRISIIFSRLSFRFLLSRQSLKSAT